MLVILACCSSGWWIGPCQRSPDDAHMPDFGVVHMMLCHPSIEHDAGGLGSRLCCLLFCWANPRPSDAHDAWLVDFWLLLVFVVFVCVCQKTHPTLMRMMLVSLLLCLGFLHHSATLMMLACAGCVQDKALLMRMILDIWCAWFQQHAPVMLMMFGRLESEPDTHSKG